MAIIRGLDDLLGVCKPATGTVCVPEHMCQSDSQACQHQHCATRTLDTALIKLTPTRAVLNFQRREKYDLLHPYYSDSGF